MARGDSRLTHQGGEEHGGEMRPGGFSIKDNEDDSGATRFSGMAVLGFVARAGVLSFYRGRLELVRQARTPRKPG